MTENITIDSIHQKLRSAFRINSELSHSEILNSEEQKFYEEQKVKWLEQEEKIRLEKVEIHKKQHEEFMKNNPEHFDSLFPVRFQGLNDVIHKKAFKSYDFKRGAFITGSVGSGKTVFSIQILKEMQRRFVSNINLFRESFDFTRISAVDLVMELQNIKEETPIEEKVDKYKKVEILLIDDFGTEKNTNFVAQCIYSILNHRYENNLITIVTSNFGRNEFDDRIASRFSEMGQIIKLDGKDLRIKGVKNGN